MSQEWVLTSPVLLTDDMFFSYVPTPLYSGTATQRTAAYLAAEQSIIREIGSPLIPTTITGTWMWPASGPTIVMPFRRVQTVDNVTVLYGGGTGSCGLQETAGCYRVRDDGYGYLDVHCAGAAALARGCGSIANIYQVRITYTTGLPSGISIADTSLHLALSMVAEEVLTEIIDPGANPGGPGAPGVTSYGSMGYSEQLNKMSLKMTSMGASARMNAARRSIRHLILKRTLKM